MSGTAAAQQVVRRAQLYGRFRSINNQEEDADAFDENPLLYYPVQHQITSYHNHPATNLYLKPNQTH